MTSTTVAAVDQAISYFDAYTEDNRRGYDAMLELAAPGSAAWDYAYHQSRLMAAGDLVGVAHSPSSIRVDGDDIVLCTDDACREDIRFGDFAFRQGLLANFTIEGRELSQMISTWPEQGNSSSLCWTQNNAECNSPDSIDATVRSAYRTANGDVYVTYDLVLGSNVRGEVRHDSIVVNDLLTPGSELYAGGFPLKAADWYSFVPSPGGYSVGMFTFMAPPEGSPLQFKLLLRWSNQLIDFNFDLGRLD